MGSYRMATGKIRKSGGGGRGGGGGGGGRGGAFMIKLRRWPSRVSDFTNTKRLLQMQF